MPVLLLLKSDVKLLQESRVGAAERDLKPRLGIRSHKREALEEAGPAPKLEEERKAERASDGRYVTSSLCEEHHYLHKQSTLLVAV